MPPSNSMSKATVLDSQRDALFRPHSAGWLIPAETSVCKPVFVAYSVLSAIWLLKETLAKDALPADAWARLKEPPSAQQPRDSLPPSTKRAAASSSARPSKRLRRASESPSPATPLEAEDEAEEPEQLAPPSKSEAAEDPKQPVRGQVGHEEPPQITSVSNKNRRAKQERARKLELMRAQKKQDLRLVLPPESASRREHGAYASILRQDEPFISWILKQLVNDDDLYSSTATPYLTASGMLKKANSIGNTTSQASAAAFLRSWRTQGLPFTQESVEDRPPASSRTRWSLSQKNSSSTVPKSALASAWSLCDRYKQDKAYTKRIDQIKEQDVARSSDAKNRGSRGKVSSEAMDALLLSATAMSGRQQRQRFKKQLHQALRWYEAAKQLGWGMLCLMPHNIISNFMALDAWLGLEGISGGSISEKATLSIEADTPTPATQVEEIEDSEMEDGEDTKNGDDDGAEDALSQGPAKSPAPARLMRQLTLIELCKPF
ncbi:uncharacterized protein EKO05_0007125 [Ascochyta rabiei]|uniref:uncharacterized protein n=1 Tax=Didymella rabiei TaxID=5454 RepID=UPI00220B4E00|nr:uncharacterized protein EKO05_0007125 [Ascochyta rabiei]UPX16738.1 hypothetical protein EKO05_0007125 [Ascochyta rabiei]